MAKCLAICALGFTRFSSPLNKCGKLWDLIPCLCSHTPPLKVIFGRKPAAAYNTSINHLDLLHQLTSATESSPDTQDCLIKQVLQFARCLTTDNVWLVGCLPIPSTTIISFEFHGKGVFFRLCVPFKSGFNDHAPFMNLDKTPLENKTSIHNSIRI